MLGGASSDYRQLIGLRVLQCAGVLKRRTRFRAFCRTDACYHIRRSQNSPLIARPYYSTALARHGQILLATQPSRPGALWSTFSIRTLGDLKAIAFALQPHSSSGERGAWERPFIRLGARLGSPFDAEAMLSDGFIPSLMFTQNFISLMELFFAVQLCFLTVSQQVFEDSLSEVQRQFLSAAGRETEIALWKGIGEDLRREHQDIVARGVRVTTQPPADVLAALRTAAEPEIQRWAQSMGADGANILAEYRSLSGASNKPALVTGRCDLPVTPIVEGLTSWAIVGGHELAMSASGPKCEVPTGSGNV